MQNISCANKILVRKPEEKDMLGELGVDGRIILKLILKNYDVRMWTRFVWFRIESSSRLL
jgi:hypothetical protein